MTRKLSDVAGAGALDHFMRQGVVAHGLPPFVYTGQDFWALEQERLFPKTWVFVGFAHELSRPGDAVPVSVAGKPVLLVCNQQGAINAFHNVCRHRCLKIVDQAANLGPRIRCPYHSWVYSLDGELRSTPYFGGPDQHVPDGFEVKDHGLIPVRSALWHDWVFVNLDASAPGFDEFVRPLANRLEGIDFECLKPVATLDFGPVQCNWKLLMENFIEPYHVQFVHSSTTQQPLTDHYTVVDGNCLGSAVDISRVMDGAQCKDTLAVSSRYLTLFPNFVLGRYFPDQIGVHLNVPCAVNETRQRRVIYTTDGVALEDEQVKALETLWFNVHKEDHAMCERLQEGRASKAAEQGGLLSPHWETSVRRFQELVVEAVQ